MTNEVTSDRNDLLRHYPNGLDEHHQAIYDQLLLELRELYGAVLVSDQQLLVTVVQAAQAEQRHRQMAEDALNNGLFPLYDVLTRHARSEAGVKRAGMTTLGLLGYNKQSIAKDAKRKIANQVGTVSEPGDEWHNLIPRQ
jgi:hypothetical protein